MLLKKPLIIIFCFVLNYSYSQVNKADYFYKIGNYQTAIVYYEKAVKTDTSLILLRKLEECYYKCGNYKSAESICTKLISNDNNADDIYQYGLVLVGSGRYDQAILQFEKIQSQKKYTEKVLEQLSFCKKNQLAKKSDTSYIVSNHKNFNTSKNEFSPFILGENLCYTSEITNIDLYQVQQNQIIYALKTRKIYNTNTPKVFFETKTAALKTINKTGTNGVASFSDSDQVLYYTDVSLAHFSKDSSKMHKPNIYFSKINKEKWTAPQPLQWNDSRYSFEHPAISKDGKFLVFSSDMPGGYGKSDLYSCEKQNGQWSPPKNLGAIINTSENEVFPYLSDKNTMCFSSNGHVGFGGLDIFQAKLIGNQWTFVQNFGVNINSNKDDFGICFTYKDSLGLFSSNRDGGLGGDDIYDLISLRKETRISANIYLTENINAPAKNRKLYLLNSKGERIDSTFTDQYGHFDFKLFNTEKSFMVEVDENDLKLKNKARYYIIDNNNNTTRISHNLNGKKKYVFKSLPIDPNGLPDLFEEDTLNLAGKIFLKSIVTAPLGNRKVMLINEFGDIIEKTTTNESGAFAFRNLPPSQNYSIYVYDEGIPNDAQIILTNKDGKEIKTTKIDEQNNLNFEILSIDKSSRNDLAVKNDELLMNLSGFLYDQNKKVLENMRVAILDNEVSVQTILTDADGRFQTQKLDVNKTYSFLIEDIENKFDYVDKLYLADSKKRIYKEVARKKGDKFRFNLLSIDKYLLGDNTFDDEDLSLKLKNKQKINKDNVPENTDVAYHKSGKSVTQVSKIQNKIESNDALFSGQKQDAEAITVIADTKSVELKNEKKINDSTIFKTNSNSLSSNINLQGLSMKSVETKAGVIVSENLNYTSGEWKVNSAISKSLDNLVSVLKLNPLVAIEINSHTDSKGSDAFNLLLSKKRANAVFNYLASKGISQKRLIAIGHGETKLLNHCNNEVTCEDSEHIVNRRTEFRLYNLKK